MMRSRPKNIRSNLPILNVYVQGQACGEAIWANKKSEKEKRKLKSRNTGNNSKSYAHTSVCGSSSFRVLNRVHQKLNISEYNISKYSIHIHQKGRLYTNKRSFDSYSFQLLYFYACCNLRDLSNIRMKVYQLH